MARPPITAATCAIGFAIPLTRADLERALAAPRPGGFVDGLRAAFPGASPDDLWGYYRAELGERLERWLPQLERLGVTVIRRLDGPALRDALARFRLLAIVAHHPAPPITPADVVDTAALVAAAVAQRDAPGGELLRARLAGIAATPAAVAAVLDALVAESAPSYQVIARDRARATGYVWSRLALERRFPTQLAAGAAIELADGLYTLPGLRAAFPADFDGALDLVVCNSVLHAEDLTRRFPRARFFAAQSQVAPAALVAGFVAAMAVLARLPDGAGDDDLFQALAQARRSLR